MTDRLISGDNHIDLTYCPPDLWSSQAPAKWKLLVPRVEELEDGCHWFVDAVDRGMWNGVGPGFLPVHEGRLRPHRRDEGRRLRVELSARRQAAADHSRAAPGRSRPRRARQGDHLRLPDDQRPHRRRSAARPGRTRSTTRGRRTSPRRAIPTACSRSPSSPTTIPRTRPPRCGAAPSWGCAAATSPSSAWACRSITTTGTPCGRRRRSATSPSPSTPPASRALRTPDTPADGEGVHGAVAAGALGALPARHHGGAGVDHRLRRLRGVPELQVRARRVRRDVAALRVRPARHRVRGPRPRSSASSSSRATTSAARASSPISRTSTSSPSCR